MLFVDSWKDKHVGFLLFVDSIPGMINMSGFYYLLISGRMNMSIFYYLLIPVDFLNI